MRAFQAAILIGALVSTEAEGAPLQYLDGAGAKAMPVVWLTWGLLLISVAVIAIVGLLLAGAIWHRPAIAWSQGANMSLKSAGDGLDWLWYGAGLSALVLLASVVWTVKVLADIQAPPVRPAVTIEITGRQWWWQVRYLSDDGSRRLTTANEIHIPTGQPVRLKLVGGDVIHSFWVPKLAGKMDTIPGQTNETWIEADRAGTYVGQCTEYCGLEHSRMQVRVIAQTPADFRAWRAHQLAAPVTGSSALFAEHCGGCHGVRGTAANGTFGPDLSHLMQRHTLAATVLANDGVTLSRWIDDPQSLKPGNRMPKVKLSAGEHAQIVAWLRSLN